MTTQGSRRLEYAALGLAVLGVPVAAVIVLEVTALARFDPSRVTRWTAVGGALLALAAVALPALLLSGWQSAQRSAREDATRERRRP
ncbi:hypothetical protein [Haloterrigena salinisoli]|uniref:hypothetical protein n=1 Tax=Haloterrigena salinisoli TaxID=3132747 RepID=UPI0030D624B1